MSSDLNLKRTAAQRRRHRQLAGLGPAEKRWSLRAGPRRRGSEAERNVRSANADRNRNSTTRAKALAGIKNKQREFLFPAVSALPPPSPLRPPKTAAKPHPPCLFFPALRHHTRISPGQRRFAPLSNKYLSVRSSLLQIAAGSSRSRMAASAITICCRRPSQRLRALNRCSKIASRFLSNARSAGRYCSGCGPHSRTLHFVCF